eukprot:899785-Prymnesium_polylepis.1
MRQRARRRVGRRVPPPHPAAVRAAHTAVRAPTGLRRGRQTIATPAHGPRRPRSAALRASRTESASACPRCGQDLDARVAPCRCGGTRADAALRIDSSSGANRAASGCQR